MEAFLLLEWKDIENQGDCRIKLVILDIYDRIQRAVETGGPYQTFLDYRLPTRASRMRCGLQTGDRTAFEDP